jgi:bacteriorhodopsin
LSAALTYFTLAAGGSVAMSIVHIYFRKDGFLVKWIFRTIYWGRYVDWAISTSLMLVEMTLLAGLSGIEIVFAVFVNFSIFVFVLSH